MDDSRFPAAPAGSAPRGAFLFVPDPTALPALTTTPASPDGRAPRRRRRPLECGLGGLRCKRESTLPGAYELEPLDTVAGIRRYLEVGLIDLTSVENSVARNRALVTGVLAAVIELEERLEIAANVTAMTSGVQAWWRRQRHSDRGSWN